MAQDSKITWSDSFSVDILPLDGEHKHLAELLNGLIGAMEAGEPPQACLDRFDGLVTAVRQHFQNEEQVMRNIGLHDPGHKRQHDNLLSEAQGYRDLLSEHLTNNEVAQAAHFLRFWLLRHVTTTDAKIRDHLRAGTSLETAG